MFFKTRGRFSVISFYKTSLITYDRKFWHFSSDTKNYLQCDVNPIITLPIKTITSVLKCTVTSITARHMIETCSDTSNNVCLDLHNCRYSRYQSVRSYRNTCTTRRDQRVLDISQFVHIEIPVPPNEIKGF